MQINVVRPHRRAIDPAFGEAPGTTPITASTVIPMKASGYTIREGISWQLSNTFEF